MFVSETSFRKQKKEAAAQVVKPEPPEPVQPARIVEENYYDENDVIFDDEYYY